MNNINYQKWLDKKTDEISKSGIIPTLLLHSCCAPCSSYVLEYLSKYFEITDLYYKPSLLICFENGEDIGKGSGDQPGWRIHLHV